MNNKKEDENSMIKKLKEMINNSNRIVFFGGAGVSTESGIPDFRSTNGLYNKLENNNPEYLLSHNCFVENPHLFYEYFKKHFDFRSYSPNITHYKLAELEKAGKLMGVITQNVDGLHSKAGSRNVCELHGNAEAAYCCKCKRKYSIQDILKNEKCKCGEYIRPDIVLYGEYLKDENWSEVIYLIRKADLLIVAGTSLTVYPAKTLLSYAHCPIVIINKDKVDFEADLVINDSCGNVFKKLIK